MSDLAELFARNPLELSSQDITAIVDHLRASRVHFTLTEKPAAKKPAAKAKKTSTPAKPLTLDDLDI